MNKNVWGRREAKRGVTKGGGGRTTGQRLDLHGTEFHYFCVDERSTNLTSFHTLTCDVDLKVQKQN